MGTKSLEDIIVQVDENIDLIPGGSGIYELSQLDVIQRYNLLNQVNELDEHYDFFDRYGTRELAIMCFTSTHVFRILR